MVNIISNPDSSPFGQGAPESPNAGALRFIIERLDFSKGVPDMATWVKVLSASEPFASDEALREYVEKHELKAMVRRLNTAASPSKRAMHFLATCNVALTQEAANRLAHQESGTEKNVLKRLLIEMDAEGLLNPHIYDKAHGLEFS